MRRPHLGEPELIRRLYAHLLDEELWSRVLALVTREFDSTYSVMLRRNRLTDSMKITATDALPREWQRSYETHYAQLSPKSFFYADASRAGKVLTDALYEDYEAYLCSEIYHDFFRPLRADHLMFMELRRDRTEQESLVVRRSSRDGFYDADAARRFARLCRHVSNGARLLQQLRASERQAKNYGALLDGLEVTAFLTDRTGVIRHMTEAAERLLRDGAILVARGGRLAARHAEFDPPLRAAIRECAESVDHAEMWPSRTLRVHSRVDDPWSPTVDVSSILWTDPDGHATPASLIIVNEPRGHRTEFLLGIARRLGLTPAESRLAVGLCEGHALSEYARSAGISVMTARTLLKRAREKTDTHSQAELVSLLLRSVFPSS